jgi:hypothetical protein
MNMDNVLEDWRSAIVAHYLRVRVIRRNARSTDV